MKKKKVMRKKGMKKKVSAKKKAISKLSKQGRNRLNEIYAQEQPNWSTVDAKEPTASILGRKGGMKEKEYLEEQARQTANKADQLERQLQEENIMLNDLIARRKGGRVPNESAKTFKHNLEQGMDSKFMPGNVGDINKVIWPFWFTDDPKGVIVRPNQSNQGQVTITQEAAFIIVHYTKAVFVEGTTNGSFNGQFTFVDPAQDDKSGKSNGLTMTLRDSQSTRTFHNLPMNINQVGYWRAPTVLPTPVMFLPNSNIEVSYNNSTNDTSYKVFTTFFGYRLRLEHAKDILSLVSGE